MLDETREHPIRTVYVRVKQPIGRVYLQVKGKVYGKK